MTKSKEDYIKAIYELGGSSRTISNKEISEVLNISPPSVSEMIKKLVKENYVVYQQYRGVILTDFGIDEAKKVRRRHLLWEVFLVEKLGYSWDEVDEEAEKLEHITSEKLEERLESFLNYPKYCPHGNLINEDIELESIVDCFDGEYFRIKRVYDNKEILDYFNELDLKLGMTIKISRKNDEFKILCNNKEIILNKDLGKYIYGLKEDGNEK